MAFLFLPQYSKTHNVLEPLAWNPTDQSSPFTIKEVHECTHNGVIH